MQWPTGQAALGLREGVAKGSLASTALQNWAKLMRRGERLKREPARPVTGIRQFSPLQCQQQAANNDRAGIDAPGQRREGHSVAFVVSEDVQHMNGHGKTATGLYIRRLNVTIHITHVNRFVVLRWPFATVDLNASALGGWEHAA